MKSGIVCCFMMTMLSSFARSDSQIPPTITPDLLVIFFELWRDSGFGRHPDRIEESAWILKKPSGDYLTVRWPASGKKDGHLWRGPVPNGVVAIAHTHTVRADPKPSKKDITVSIRLRIQFYTISEKGIWIVDHGNVKKVFGGDWDKSLQETQTQSSPSHEFNQKLRFLFERSEFTRVSPIDLVLKPRFGKSPVLHYRTW